MRFAASLALLAGALALSACNPLEPYERFDVGGEQVISIPGKNLVSDPLVSVPVEGLGDELGQSISSTFENQGVDANDVDSFFPKEMLIEITKPLDRDGNPLQDLRFFDRITFVLSAPGLSETEVARSAEGAFAAGVGRYTFPIDAEHNLKDYLAAESMTLTVDAKANDRPALGCDVRFVTTFSVDVNPAGLID